jgi:nitrogenase molybdenum-iron protein beta chain
MVGDDVAGMTREVAEQGETVLYSGTAGFHGDSHFGYERVMPDLIEGLAALGKTEKNGKRAEKRVNIFGVLPKTDVHFKGDLEEIKRILKGIGGANLEIGVFFGPGDGVEELIAAPGADLNLVFSKWGISIGEKLKEKYGVPMLAFPAIPTGCSPVREMAEAVVKKLDLDKTEAEAFLEEEEARFRYYLKGLEDVYNDENAGKAIGIVGDESTVIRIGGFLKSCLGATIAAAVVTDSFPNGQAHENENALNELGEKIYRTQDGREISDILTRSEADLILGSSLETEIAQKLDIPSLEISYPIRSRLILNKTYSGLRGALRLTEDYLSAITESNRTEEKRLTKKIRTGNAV